MAWTALAVLLVCDAWLAWRALSPPEPGTASIIARNHEDVERAAIRLEASKWTPIDTLAASAFAGLHVAAGIGLLLTRKRD